MPVAVGLDSVFLFVAMGSARVSCFFSAFFCFSSLGQY